MRRSAPKIVLAVAALVGGCGGPPATSRTSKPVIYGDDDRQELFELEPDDPVTAFAATRVAAMVPASQVSIRSKEATLSGATWADASSLCEGVRFADQPQLARCTATLVTSDLVVTAAHCARLCAQTRLVFGVYYVEPDLLRTVREADVYDCVDVVVDRREPSGVDFAWLRLDRPRPLPDASWRPPPTEGERLTLVGFPAGVPMKVDRRGTVTSVASSVFFSDHDAFAGHSGGPLLDEGAHVAGVLGGGAPDLEVTSEGCRVVVTASTSDGAERSTTMADAIDGLCERSPCEAVCPRSSDACAPSTGCNAVGQERRSSTSRALVLLVVLGGALRPRRQWYFATIASAARRNLGLWWRSNSVHVAKVVGSVTRSTKIFPKR